MALKQFTFTAPDIAGLSDGTNFWFDHFDGDTAYLNISGIGFAEETSTWQFITTADKDTFELIGTSFNGGETLLRKGIAVEGAYLGVRLITKADETAGQLVVKGAVK